MNFETDKAWMVRSDGMAFPCVCHIYGSDEDIEETLYAAQWLFEHTAKECTKTLCLRLFKTYGISIAIHCNCVRAILQKIRKTPCRFLDYDFIFSISDQIQQAEEGNLEALNARVNWALNNEFMRVRYSGMCNSEKGNQKLYFRLSNDELLTPEWINIIQKIVKEHKDQIVEPIAVGDEESTEECRRLL